jgi:hypothetical protein
MRICLLAEICYAYLFDVSGPFYEGDKFYPENMDTFRFSKWFTRGWTLQELLAPDELTFLDKDVCMVLGSFLYMF